MPLGVIPYKCLVQSPPVAEYETQVSTDASGQTAGTCPPQSDDFISPG